jgi:[ribosomal protein S5]-alanine N-acetyltransferase
MSSARDPTAVRIATDRLILRIGTAADVPAILRYFAQNRHFLAPFEPRHSAEFYTEAFWNRQVQTNLREFAEDRSLRLFLFDRAASGEMIGTANFAQFVRGAFHACYLGYSLAERAQGSGLMREALGAAIPFVFDELRIHRIMANYMPHNQRSGTLLRALGFVVEGYARDYLRINGRWEDHVLTSLTSPRWEEPPSPPAE